MRPLMWTIGAFRPNAQLFALLSAWFYRHPGLSSFRPSISKALEEPSALSSAFTREVDTCNVRLSGDTMTLVHPRSPCLLLTVGCCRHQRVPPTVVKSANHAHQPNKWHTCALLWKLRCRCCCKRGYSRVDGDAVQRNASSVRQQRELRRHHAHNDGHDERLSAFGMVGIGLSSICHAVRTRCYYAGRL